MGVHDCELSTQDRILNASESLFADFGFDGVSLRRITQHAGVELALANYHFGPKKDLFLAVIRRRADELNRARVRALDALEPDDGDGGSAWMRAKFGASTISSKNRAVRQRLSIARPLSTYGRQLVAISRPLGCPAHPQLGGSTLASAARRRWQR